MDSTANPLHLFSAIGIEIEYMIVDKATLNILPIADKILAHFAGHLTNETELGEIAISNELVNHVIEFKTNGPKPFSLALHLSFHEAIQKVNHYLAGLHAMLLPTGMHPWLNPQQGVELWSHGDKTIYFSYDRIFGCKGHGWSNLQSTHINLPFANDAEFKLLHNAIRIVLPLIPALTASSPLVEGSHSGHYDSRLHYYHTNQAKIPSITGAIVPEFIESEADYQDKILATSYKAIAPHDPEGILQFEWLNSRGAIARFDRMAIEIRVLDSQESPYVDIAYAYLIQQLLKYLIEQTNQYLTHPLHEQQLKTTFLTCATHGSQTLITDLHLIAQLDIESHTPLTAQTIWLILLDKLLPHYLTGEEYTQLKTLIQLGSLAERIQQTIQHDTSPTMIHHTYHRIASCLAKNTVYTPS